VSPKCGDRRSLAGPRPARCASAGNGLAAALCAPLTPILLRRKVGAAGASVADRDKVYADDAAHWGHDWIAIPNPTYGSFESSPYLTDYSKSVDEQRKEKLAALKPWAGPAQ
jgi:hypothetical protein